MAQICDVAIIGTGPHGLSMAAHLKARGIKFRIFGKPMGTWADHMPKGMMLKSDGFASNLSAPARESTLKAYCARNNVPYADEGLPIPLKTFLEYATWFRKRYVSELEDTMVTALKNDGEVFELTLQTGEIVAARNVVMAVGITWFAYTPEVLAGLPASLGSHSEAYGDVTHFKGRDVAVIGAGASAVNLADELANEGVRAHIITREAEIEYNRVPDASDQTLFARIQRPASGIGRGWRSVFCAQAPLLFYRLPDSLKQRAIRSHMHPAAGFYMRGKLDGRVETTLSRSIHKAEAVNGKVVLTLADNDGALETKTFDHVVSATGYRPDMRRVSFLSRELCEKITLADGSPILSDGLETPVRGLFVTGPAAMNSFGPLMRFMVAAEFAAPHIAGRLERKLGSWTSNRAA
ncbi:MAG TPA: NAD(P)-binding domain-containing protein [Rhizomicrobium sp.]|nr:NAD(P)-binding domain-containing protein [Rhizomicrobium sp.]